MGEQLEPKAMRKNCKLLIDVFVDFWTVLAPFRNDFFVPENLLSPRTAPKTPRSRASRAESPPEDPQGRPGPPKDLILGAYGAVLVGILDHFGVVWGTSWV